MLLIVLTIWHVQVGTKLIQDEVTSLEEVGFVLCEQQRCAHLTLFGNENSTLINQPLDPNS
jgi:hypothetical protein